MGIATLFRKQATPEIADQVDSRALDQLFRKARTHNGWQPIGVPDTLLKEAVELAKSYGGTDGYKFVNGVLDKLAPELRAAEMRASTRDE